MLGYTGFQRRIESHVIKVQDPAKIILKESQQGQQTIVAAQVSIL